MLSHGSGVRFLSKIYPNDGVGEGILAAARNGVKSLMQKFVKGDATALLAYFLGVSTGDCGN